MPKKLADMTVKELRAEATRLKIDGRSSLTTKEMLVKAVSKAKAKKAKSPAKKAKSPAKKAKSPAKKAKSPAKKAKSPAKKAKSPAKPTKKQIERRVTMAKTQAAKRRDAVKAKAGNIRTILQALPRVTFKRLVDMKNGEKIVLAMTIEQGLYQYELEDSIMPITTMMRKHKATFTKTGRYGDRIAGTLKNADGSVEDYTDEDGLFYKSRGLAVTGSGADTAIEWDKLGTQKVYWE